MELVSLSYLRECNYVMPKLQPYRELFEDPLRNGTLIMLVVCRRFNCKAEFQPKPKSIEDCRNNYKTAMNLIRSHVPGFPKVYYEITE
jgi:hypothetical protein